MGPTRVEVVVAPGILGHLAVLVPHLTPQLVQVDQVCDLSH